MFFVCLQRYGPLRFVAFCCMEAAPSTSSCNSCFKFKVCNFEVSNYLVALERIMLITVTSKYFPEVFFWPSGLLKKLVEASASLWTQCYPYCLLLATGRETFQVVLLGEGAVGKTSLLLRFVENKFNPKHVSTLQVYFSAFLFVVKGTLRLTDQSFFIDCFKQEIYQK